MISGKELIRLGFAPSKLFSLAIAEFANRDNVTDDSIVSFMNTHVTKVYELQPPVPFHKNILVETDEEVQNLNLVIADMESIMVTPHIVDGCIMPDSMPTSNGHIPVGGVIVTNGTIHPSWHSADICCSVMMTNFGKVDPKEVLDAANNVTHFGPGGRPEYSELTAELYNEFLTNKYLSSARSMELAASHLGTQGDGNHFLFVGVSKSTGDTMLVTHHGSRGVGAALYKKGIMTAESFRKEISPMTNKKNAWIPYDSDEGREYWSALQIVRKWTKLNHNTIHTAVSDTINIKPINNIWNEHNFVFKDGDLFYHAKGATPLDAKFVPDSADGLRLIPLNMSEPILVVKGDTTSSNLGFAPHGAGRNIGRSQHKRNNSDRTIDEIFKEETAKLDVRFFSNRVDISELPSAYKNASEIRKQMDEFNLGTVVDEIMPYGCIMAGEFDRTYRPKQLNRKKQR